MAEPSAGGSKSNTSINLVEAQDRNNNNLSRRSCPNTSQDKDEEEELRRLGVPKLDDLPLTPPSAIEANFVTYFAPDFMKPAHDHLCVVGLASTHLAFKDEGGVTDVDFNVGKSDRSEIKNAQHFESNTALCKVSTKDSSYIVRCCVKGSLLEVNERLFKHPELLNLSAVREGYNAIIMQKLGDWRKLEASLVGSDEYKKLRTISGL